MHEITQIHIDKEKNCAYL